KSKNEDAQTEAAEEFAEFSSLDRYVCLAGIILWAGAEERKKKRPSLGAAEALKKLTRPDPIVTVLGQVFRPILENGSSQEPQIWQVSLNRKAMLALDRSVPSVKGDAARTLFNVKCDKIRWAVLDSGIDGNHPVFNDREGNSRIIKAFDFSNIRQIVSLDNLDTDTPVFKAQLDKLLKGREKTLSRKQATEDLQNLAEDAENDRPIHWELVEKFITIDPKDTKNPP